MYEYLKEVISSNETSTTKIQDKFFVITVTIFNHFKELQH